MRVTAKFDASHEVTPFLRNLTGPEMKRAAARGLNEHAEEQRRQSIVRMVAVTGVPSGRVAGKTTVKRARAGASMAATIQTADVAIPLAEYGNPVWTRDLNPGWKGGAVSSMAGAVATGWNRRKTFSGTWVAKGQVMKKKDRNDNRSGAQILYGPILAYELAKPSWTNARSATSFAQLDLEKRVTRHVLRALGT